MRTRKKHTRKLKKYNVFLLIIILVLAILLFLNTYIILKYNVLPYKYLVVYFAIIIIVPSVSLFILIKKQKNRILKIIFASLMIIFEIFLGFIFYYLCTTFNFLDRTFITHNYITRNYYVLVDKKSDYKKIDDLNNKNLGYVEVLNMNYDKAIEHINSKIKIDTKDYIDLTIMLEAFELKELDALLMVDDYYKLISEEDDTIEDKYTIIYEFSLKEDIEDFTKDIDVTKDPFIVLISGMDNAGDITSITRSDVNIVVVVNPKTYQILMIHIPRDYYVKLHGQENRDKLTHSGLYGTEMTVKTIEDLLQIDINYYFKVNFMSVVDIVNALGGVDVYSKYTFRTVDYDYYFEKGYNRINGKQALEFVRTRKVLKGGDRARGENQQALIQAVVKKATSPAILTKYSSLLESVNGKFITNLSSEKMLQIIKLQIDKMPKWNFTSISLDGFDSENYSSVFPTIKKYVMEPDQKTIDAAMEAIKDVFDGKILDSSYQENTSGWVNTPHVYVPPKEEPEEEEPDENLEEENPDLEDDPNLDEEGNPIDPNNPTTDPDNPTEPTPGETSPDPTDPNPGNPDGGDSSGTGSGSTTGSETTPPGTEAETSGNTNTGTDSSTSSKNNP